MSHSPEPLPSPRREGLKIFVEGLRVEAGIGVYDHEHGRLQTLLIDVTLDLGPTEIHGLADTVNYETVAAACRRIVAEGHVGLVETFAERLALDCLSDPRVRAVTVRIDKPGALEAAAGAGCELHYSR